MLTSLSHPQVARFVSRQHARLAGHPKGWSDPEIIASSPRPPHPTPSPPNPSSSGSDAERWCPDPWDRPWDRPIVITLSRQRRKTERGRKRSSDVDVRRDWLHTSVSLVTLQPRPGYTPVSAWLHSSINLVTLQSQPGYTPVSAWLHSSLSLATHQS